MLLLQILSGRKAGTTSQAKKFPFTIGRSGSAHLSLDDPGLWDHHAEIQIEMPLGLVLKLKPNALGTVNNEPVANRPLRNGDIIALGSAKFQVFLAAVQVRDFRSREILTWLALGFLCLFQIFLIYTLL